MTKDPHHHHHHHHMTKAQTQLTQGREEGREGGREGGMEASCVCVYLSRFIRCRKKEKRKQDKINMRGKARVGNKKI